MSTDAELVHEQGALDRARELLEAMRRRAEGLLLELRAAGRPDPDLEMALVRRVLLLEPQARPLCFGRIDEVGGETFYIGRRHVEDEVGSPAVIEWRAPVAAAFYQARPSDPLGLKRRRQFVVEGQRLVQMADDLFGESASLSDPRLRGGDALLAELERTRSGEMADIVATIQAEQDDVIRAHHEGVLTVQGGPGTGKTAIALHRAAYLLFNLPELSSKGVLVVGPNRVFLSYIAAVLPALGEEAVVQTTLTDLVSDIAVRSRASEAEEVAKGDEAMAEVLARDLSDHRRPLREPLVVEVGFRRVVVAPEEVNAAVEAIASRLVPYNTGRAATRDRLVGLVHRGLSSSRGVSALSLAELARGIRGDKQLKAALDRLWPALSPVALVSGLLSSPERLERATAGLLSDDARRAIARERAPARGMGWTPPDAPLVDEARELLEGRARQYGHVIVDEAQDLSAMAWRMLGRRSRAGSMTLFGDFAQQSAPGALSSFDEVLGHLFSPVPPRHESLSLGYRAPGEVLELASRLLPLAAPRVPPTESVRVTGRAPRVVKARGDLAATVLEEVRRSRLTGRRVGVIAPEELHAILIARFNDAGLELGLPERHGLSKEVTLTSPVAAKGLEFDTAVVVEPALIAAGGARGLRLLYVALTRPTWSLSIVHGAPLPAGLTVSEGTGHQR